MRSVILWGINVILFSAIVIYGLSLDKKKDQNKSHTCIYEYCPYKGDKTFTHGCGSCLPGTDCYRLDSVHFVYPTWDYDKCDSLLFYKPFKTN